MRLRKIIIAVLAALIIPFGMNVEAAKHGSKHHKTSVKKSSHKRTSSSKTVSAEKAAADAKKATTDEKTDSKKTTASAGDVSGETIVKTAMQYIGVPYRPGSSSSRGFDCSGFTSYVYKALDINLLRSSRSQYTQGMKIKDKGDLQAGDLVFFRGRSSRGIGHVGIVTEVDKDQKSFKFVHAKEGGVCVDDSKLAYYSKRYVGARRIVDQEK